MYIDVYQIIKNWERGPYNSLRLAYNRKYISGLFLMQNRAEVHMFYLARKWERFGDVLAEGKWTLLWLMNSNMVKPEQFDHLHLVYHFTVPLSLFYRYYIGRCSPELTQLVPLPCSWGRSACYSDRSHYFSVIIPRCHKNVYVKSFFLQNLLWISINLPYIRAWDTVVVSGVVLLVATWNCQISCENGYAELSVLHLVPLLNPWLILKM